MDDGDDDVDKRSCYDCGVAPGQVHAPGCDNERCMLCGWQSISCPCVYEVNGMRYSDLETTYPDVYRDGPTIAMSAVYDAEVEKVGGREPWSGENAGLADARRLGWYSRWVGDRSGEDGGGWKRCQKNEEGAGPDLNRLNACSATWSRERRRWEES